MSDPGTEAGLFLLKQGFGAMPASPASGHNRRDTGVGLFAHSKAASDPAVADDKFRGRLLL